MVFILQLFGKVAWQKTEIQVRISFEFRIAENAAIHFGIVFQQCVFVTGYRAVKYAVVGEFIGDAVGNLAFPKDIQEHCPILALADWGHIKLAEFCRIVNSCQTADFVVVFHVAKGQLRRNFHHTDNFRLLIACIIAAIA